MATTRIIKKADQKPLPASVRSREPDEFEADTTEERPITLLAQRRKQFLDKIAPATDADI